MSRIGKLCFLHAHCQSEAQGLLLFRQSMWRSKVTAATLMPSLWKTCALWALQQDQVGSSGSSACSSAGCQEQTEQADWRLY